MIPLLSLWKIVSWLQYKSKILLLVKVTTHKLPPHPPPPKSTPKLFTFSTCQSDVSCVAHRVSVTKLLSLYSSAAFATIMESLLTKKIKQKQHPFHLVKLLSGGT